MQRVRRFMLLALLPVLFAGCASLSPGFEEPSVTVTSFRMLPSNSVVPKFEIGLHVINPNRSALNLVGLAYNVELEGHRILSGVASDLPVIAAYGQGDVLLQAAPDLFSSISLFTDLLNKPRGKFNFNFAASLDVGWFLPKIKVQKSGQISMPDNTRQ